MRFGPVPVADAEGAILAHSTVAGEKRLRKARRLDAGDQQFAGIARRQFRKHILEAPRGSRADRVGDLDLEEIAVERALNDYIARLPELDSIFQKLVDQIADAVACLCVGLLRGRPAKREEIAEKIGCRGAMVPGKAKRAID